MGRDSGSQRFAFGQFRNKSELIALHPESQTPGDANVVELQSSARFLLKLSRSTGATLARDRSVTKTGVPERRSVILQKNNRAGLADFSG